MNTLSKLAAVAAFTALAACGGGGEANNADANLTDLNAGMDMNMPADMNMDANMTLNGADGMNATENAIVNDLTTNSPDANLANGM